MEGSNKKPLAFFIAGKSYERSIPGKVPGSPQTTHRK
jgi:hypothetical protein